MKRLPGFLFSMILIGLMFTFFSCSSEGSGDNAPPAGTTRQWTYMVYMGADNNLSQAGIQDLNEMEMTGSTNTVAIVLQAEFSDYYTPGFPTDTRRIYVTNDNDPTAVDLGSSAGGNLDMGDPATLTAFIQWAAANYPAQHYALVIWDHGAGWKARSPQATSSLFRGAVQDETSGSFMSLPDLAKGVRDANVHMDIINFDACLMAMYEVAYEFRGLTDYMVFSEETEPGEGDPYDTILTALTSTPSMSAATLSSTIVTKYDEYYALNDRGATTKSAVTMNQIDTLDAKIMALAAELTANPTTNTVIQAAQSVTQHYTYPSNHDIYDLCSYLSANLSAGTAKTLAGEIMTIIDGMVIANATNPDGDGATNHGLAIYIPSANETSSSDLAEYELLACNQTRASVTGTWGAYLEALLAGGGTIMYGAGDFGLYLSWTKPDGSACDADLDLYVSEPDGNWYAPWMGQTTPNGFFSQDSYDSGVSEEYYLANGRVQKGYYDFIVNYYYNTPSVCTSATAHVMYKADSTDSWNELAWSPEVLDDSNIYPDSACATQPTFVDYLACLDSYSDFWYAGFTQRSYPASAFSREWRKSVPLGKNGRLIFTYGKGLKFDSKSR